MNSRFWIRALALSPFLLAASSVVVTRVFERYALAEALAVAAFLCGAALWRADRTIDRLVPIGAAIGLGGLALKGLFVWSGIGAETHDMTTHVTAPGNPLLLHIHHLFFNIGFLFYIAAAIRTVTKFFRGRI